VWRDASERSAAFPETGSRALDVARLLRLGDDADVGLRFFQVPKIRRVSSD
jgi:hypothetical protein